MSVTSLYLLSADVVCSKLFPRFDFFVANNLPDCIKATILDKLSKRGLVTSIELFRQLLSNRTTYLELSEQADVGDQFLEAIGFRGAVTDKGIEALATSKSGSHLDAVFLHRCDKVTDASIVQLVNASFSSLKSLDLGGCIRLTDCTLEAISRHCAQLQAVDLSLSEISDEGLIELSNSRVSKTLRELKLTMCLRITGEGVVAIMTNCPNLDILRYDRCPRVDYRSITDVVDNFVQRWNQRQNAQPTTRQVAWTVY